MGQRRDCQMLVSLHLYSYPSPYPSGVFRCLHDSQGWTFSQMQGRWSQEGESRPAASCVSPPSSTSRLPPLVTVQSSLQGLPRFCFLPGLHYYHSCHFLQYMFYTLHIFKVFLFGLFSGMVAQKESQFREMEA